MELELFEHIEPNFMTYAMTTIVDRALPDVRDGFKPVHRKILYSMYNRGITYNKDRAKCSEPISETMKIHGHGDTSIYGALSLMTESNESLLHPFIDGEGAFGKVYNRDSPSAARYTFCRLNKFCEDTMFSGLSKNVIDFVEESGHKRPIVLPNTFPNILIKSNSGIACAMACNFPSFNLSDVCDTTIKILNKEEVSPIVPDFSTGADCIYDETQLQSVFDNGTGSIVLRSKYTYDKENSCIEIYEIPYCTTADEILDRIEKVLKSGKCKDVLDARDETGYNAKEKRDRLKIAIDIKPKANPDVVMNVLYKLTPLQSSFSANMNCLVNNKPQVLGVKTIIEEWIKFRKQCLKRELVYDINKLEEECNKLMGLELILNELDLAISLIRCSKSEQEAMDKLQSHFKLNKPQLDYICSIKLINMNEDWLKKKISKLGDLTEEMNTMRSNAELDSYYTQTIIKQLQEVKAKYGKSRLTTIIHEDTVETTNDILIPDETCAITITKDGYVKKCTRLNTTSHKLKDGDSVILNESCTTKHTILLFTNKGNVHKVFVHTLDQTLPSNLGQYLYSLVQMDKDEKIISVQLTRGYKGCLINVFDNNKLAKVNMSSFQTEQKRTTLKNAISLESPLLAQHIIEDDINILVQSTIDKVLIVNTSDFNPKNTKNVAGDSLIKSKDNSVVKVAYRLSNIDTDKIDVEYYRGKRGSVGYYLKKTDEIILK